MLLSQLVEINEKGIVASSVHFGMMDDQQMNLNLCEGFIFNYDLNKPLLSTVGILDAIRRSYHSRTEPNIHLMIQQYGKGKSHFAVTIANFFKKTFDTPEVQGILRQVEMATSGKSKAITEGLRLYKQNQRHKQLVICISGDRGGDIRKHFLQALLKSLEEEEIEDSLAQHTCSEPLRYLEELDAGQRAIAQEYLESIGNPDGDLNCLIRLLRENNPAVIPTVKNLARQITGFIPDFSANIDIEAILKDLLDNLCSGENSQFQGILILFDELNYYLQSWAADQIGAGGTALQNITNVCETYKGKIALLSFTQIHPSKAIGISATAKESYLKISSRLAPKDSSYDEPASSLELVLDNLLIQKEGGPDWEKFRSCWDNTLLSEARTAFEKRIKIYSQKGWPLDQFYRHLSKGCFPLHPLTAYLLCNLDFTQDRTAIQFIKSYVKNFIQAQPVEQAGQLNYIYPVALVDTFIENFSNYSDYKHYNKAYGLVAGSDNPDELTVLKALFLFYASGEKLTKPDREDHEEILATLTGLSKFRLKAALDKLTKTRDIIYYKLETKLYRFFEGINPTRLEEEIEEQIKDKYTSVKDVVAYCHARIKQYLGDETITATRFVKTNKLVAADWRFEYKVYSIDGLIAALSSERTLRGTKEKGILAYVQALTQEELQDFRRTVDEHLSKSPIRSRIVVAISSEETGDLARVLLKIKTLGNKETAEKRLLGIAYEQLLQRWEEQVNKQAENLLNSCTYHCISIEKIPPAERVKPQRAISALLQDLYPFVPPVDGIDKMRSDHATGSKIVGFVSKQLLTESLTPQTLPPDSSYSTVIDTVFVNRWGLLKKTSQKYIVQKPIDENIWAAWDLISQMTELEGLPEKIVHLEKIWQALCAPPYGYSEYTFTILLAGWLAYHRKETSLRGAFTIAVKKGALPLEQTRSLKDWANTNILQKPTIFVSDWIVKGKAKLIRHKKLEPPVLSPSPMDYYQAQQYLTEVATFLESNESDPLEVDEATKTRERVITSVEKIEIWFKPVEEAEALPDTVSLEVLLQLYPQLLQSYPAIDLRPDVISVKPSGQQRDRSSQALQAIREQIEQQITAQGERAESLLTQEACSNYKAEIEQLIHQINQVPSLPPHLSNILKNSLQVADRTLLKIKEQARVSEYLLQIQRLSRNLDDDLTQQDYTHTRTEIAALAARIPANAKEAGEVQQLLQDIGQRYEELTQQIQVWEEQYSGANSPNQLLDLIKEINAQRRRFTEESSIQRISALQEHLDKEFLRVRDEELDKQLQEQQKQLQDKLILQDLENRCQQSHSIASCKETLAVIKNEQLALHDLERFRPKLLQLEEHLRQSEQGYIVQLNELHGKLSSIKTLKEAQQLQRELADKSAYYRESQEEERYEAICLEANLLINLLQISETQKVDTVQACQVEQERLLQWRDTTQEISPTVQTLLESMLANLKQTQQRLQKQQTSAASSWLKGLEKQDTRLEQFTDANEKLEAASQLLEEIAQQKNQHEQMLAPKQKQALERIFNRCIQIQNQDQESKILVLFKKLPRAQRESLHKKLAEYLSGATEEFDG